MLSGPNASWPPLWLVYVGCGTCSTIAPADVIWSAPALVAMKRATTRVLFGAVYAAKTHGAVAYPGRKAMLSRPCSPVVETSLDRSRNGVASGTPFLISA